MLGRCGQMERQLCVFSHGTAEALVKWYKKKNTAEPGPSDLPELV